jgi:formamidopyrimidine-DNA glycosylase
MPELPDITIYLEALEKKTLGKKLNKVRLHHPFLLKTVEPPITAVEGKVVKQLRRIGKRIAFGFDDELWLVIHLMLAGRLQWQPPGFKLSSGYYLAAFDFDHGSVIFTEAGSKRLAMLHILQGEAALAAHDPGGLEVMDASLDQFKEVLRSRSKNISIKKVLTDPKVISGIGNSYSDEILHRARMSPFSIARTLDDGEMQRLYQAIHFIMKEWIDRFRAEVGEGFPGKVTAFRPEMAVHGKFGQPCPVCGAPIQRIRYAGMKETNYCPGCQTEGRLLADRVMSRLLKDDRPKHLDDLKGLFD